MSIKPSILITSSAGLVGSHTLLNLTKKGIAVRAMVRQLSHSKKRIAKIFELYGENFDSLEQYIEFVEADLLDIGSLEDALVGIDSVIHCAAIVRNLKNSDSSMSKVNVEGTANLVNVCLENKISWFLHVSSVATLGPNPEGLVDEDFFFKYNPRLSNYAISKYSAEQEVWRAYEEGLPVVIINPSFIIGPSDSENSSSAVFNAARKGIPYYTKGLGAYVAVEDVAEIIAQLYLKKFVGKRFIVSSENWENKDFISEISIAMKSEPPQKMLKEWMIFPALILFRLRKLITGKSFPLNRQVIRMAQSRNAYDNSRIVELTKINFTPVKEAIHRTSLNMLKLN